MEFFEILQQIMEEKKYGIPEVARACGLSDGTIRSMITRQAKNVTLEVAFKMARGLGVSLERLNGLPEHKEAPVSDTSDTEANKLSVSYLYNMLVENGFIRDGKDLSDKDLKFLLSVGEIIRAWFTKGE